MASPGPSFFGGLQRHFAKSQKHRTEPLSPVMVRFMISGSLLLLSGVLGGVFIALKDTLTDGFIPPCAFQKALI